MPRQHRKSVRSKAGLSPGDIFGISPTRNEPNRKENAKGHAATERTNNAKCKAGERRLEGALSGPRSGKYRKG